VYYSYPCFQTGDHGRPVRSRETADRVFKKKAFDATQIYPGRVLTESRVCQIENHAAGTYTSVSPLHMEFTKMNCEQRMRIIEEKLTAQGMTINEWAKISELDHRIVDDLIKGNLRGTHGIALNARKKMEEFFGQIFGS
jgi:hypothetical protein